MLALLVLLMILTGFAAWILGTGSGARSAMSAVESLSDGMIQAQGVDGRLAGPLHIERLIIERPNQRVSLSDVRFDWQPQALLRKELRLTSLHVGHVDVVSHLERQPEPSQPLPDDIGLPLALQADEVRIDGGAIYRGPVKLVEIGPFAFSLGFDRDRYLLELRRFAASPVLDSGQLDARASGQLTLSAHRPYAIEGEFSSSSDASIDEQAIGAVGKLTLEGSLEELHANIAASINRAQVSGNAVLHPLTDQVLTSAQLKARELDLASFGRDLPHTRLDVDLSAAENGKGELSARNADAGTYNEQKLPLTALHINFHQQADSVDFSRITATLGSVARPAGEITGSGRYADGALTLALRTEALNLQRMDRRMRPTQLAGRADIRSTDGRRELTLALTEPLQRLRQRLALDAYVVLADDEVAIDRASLQLGDGRMEASAVVALSGDQHFRAQGKVSHFRLQELGDFPQLPRLDLNGDFSLRGTRQPQLEADLSFNITDSRLAGEPLRGDGSVQLRAEQLNVPKFQLLSGANQLDIHGKLSEGSTQLSFTLVAPQLGLLGPEFDGSLQAEGTVRGTLMRPRVEATWNASDARLPSALAIDAMQGTANIALDRALPLPMMLESITADVSAAGVRRDKQRIGKMSAQIGFATSARAPLELKFQAADVDSGPWHANIFNLSASGTTARHVIEATLVEPEQTWALRAGGGLDDLDSEDMRWQGSIDVLEARGKVDARLLSSADLLLTSERVQLNDFLIGMDSGRVAVNRFSLDRAGLVTEGNIDQLQLAQLLSILRPADQELSLRTDLVLSGKWNMRLADTLSGEFRLRRESGDVTMLGNTQVTLGLGELRADVTATDGRLDLQLHAAGNRLGRIDANVETRVGKQGAPLAVAPDAPVTGRIHIDLPSLEWIAPLASPTLLADGRLRTDMTIAGTMSDPELTGKITGDGLRVALTNLGIDLRQGKLRGSFRNDTLLLEELVFRGGEGKVQVSGPIDFGGGMAAQLTLHAERFALLSRPDRRLVLSGDSNIEWEQQRASVKGTFTVDSGFFDIGSADQPQLSDDVVIVGREEKPAAKMLASLDVTVGLGDGVALSGRGLDALLDGKIRLTSDPGEPPQAHGSLRIAKGTYSAYGRELNIEQGLLQFTGALNNPSLDILAMRRGQEVAAGVSVGGTVLAPRVTLVSEPTVPDAEKLSWLVLGRGLASAGEGDLESLQAAASALLSKGAAAGVQSRIATAFGLDTFSVGGTDDTLQQRVVTLGKQISSRLYLGYQQGLESAGSVVQLRYQLTPKLSLEAETGDRSALSLFYNITFD